MCKFKRFTIDGVLIIAILCLYAIIVSIAAYFIIWNVNWNIGDQYQLVGTTAMGKFCPFCILVEDGRFWPLGLFDYNLLLLFTRTPSCTMHYMLNAVCFVLLSVCIFKLLYDIYSISNRLVGVFLSFAFSILLLSKVYGIFHDVIYAERIMSFFIILFVYCTYKLWQTDRLIYTIGAIFSAAYITFCKEPMFGALLIFAVYVLIKGKRISKNKKLLLWAIIANSIIFISLYCILIVGKNDSTYTSPSYLDLPVYVIIWQQMKRSKLFILAVVLLLVRMYAVIRKKDEAQDVVFDGLLLTGIAYMGAIAVLHLGAHYYYLPAFVFVFVPCSYFMCKYIKYHWLLFIIIMPFCLFYSYKAAKHIPYSRRSDYRTLEYIANKHQKEGYDIVLQDTGSAQDGYWKMVMPVYFSYCLQEPDYQLDTVIPERHYILLYSANKPHEGNLGYGISYKEVE